MDGSLKKNIFVKKIFMLSVKKQIMLDTFQKLFNKIHNKNVVFSQQYCKELVKVTVNQVYQIYPDKNVGKLSVNWFDENYNKTPSIDETTFCFEINFYDINTGLPWMICRFFKGVSKVCIYYMEK